LLHSVAAEHSTSKHAAVPRVCVVVAPKEK
jgi:hypothetical protein